MSDSASEPNSGKISASPAVTVVPCAVMVVVALSFAVVYPLLPHSDRLTDQGKIVSYHPLAFVGFLIGIGLFLTAYIRMLDLARGRRFSELRITSVLTSFALILAFTLMYPTNAIDVFIYAARSHLLTTFGENPSRALPLDFWYLDRFVRYSSRQWADNVSPYGPLWNFIAAPVTALDGDRILAAILGFKLINIAGLLAIAGFIYRTMLVRAPEHALSAMLLWLWNPLVLWEGIGNAHNDVIMMVPVCAAIWAWESGRIRWVLPLIVTSALIKYMAVVIVPIALVACLRREPTARDRFLLLGFGMTWTLLLLNLALYPFFDVAALWAGLQDQGGRVSGSIGYVIVGLGEMLGEGTNLRGWIRGSGYALTFGAVVIGTIACWKDPRRLPAVTFEAVTVFLLLGTMHFRAWYVIWIVALAAFTLSRRARIRAVVWSVSALLGYGHYIWIRRVWPSGSVDWFWFEVTGVMITLGPVAILYAQELWMMLRDRVIAHSSRVRLPAEPTT